MNDSKFKIKFLKYFEIHKNHFIEYSNGFKIKNEHSERISLLIDYNCHGGKYNRASCLINMTEKLSTARKIPFNSDLEYKTFALACSIEILQACLLVADDICDRSDLRRGKPCWYRREDVNLAAVNDSFILESFVFFILRDVFSDENYYVKLVDTFREVIFKTQIGQMIDLSFPLKAKSLETMKRQFCHENYEAIIVNKTAYYTYYIPIACALLLCGMDSDKEMNIGLRVAVDLGKKFQIQDDFMDCFYGPEKIGKNGKDIEENKCSWLVVMALQISNKSQAIEIFENYGINEKSCRDKIQEIYEKLDLRRLYNDQEMTSYEAIRKYIEDNDEIISKEALLPMLNQIQMRHC